jgi:hypothetical protein
LFTSQELCHVGPRVQQAPPGSGHPSRRGARRAHAGSGHRKWLSLGSDKISFPFPKFPCYFLNSRSDWLAGGLLILVTETMRN